MHGRSHWSKIIYDRAGLNGENYAQHIVYDFMADFVFEKKTGGTEKCSVSSY